MRPEHIVVEAADERAGLGAGEELHRHPLHVVIDQRAQVEDDSLADARGEEPLRQQQARVERRRAHNEQRDAQGTVPAASERRDVIALITSPASTGVATAIVEEATTVKEDDDFRVCRRAKRSTRSAVTRPTRLSPSSSLRRIEHIMLQLLDAMPPIGWPTPALPHRPKQP